MGQAKARGTLEERIAQSKAEPQKPRKMSKREAREFVAAATMEYVGKIFSGVLTK